MWLISLGFTLICMGCNNPEQQGQSGASNSNSVAATQFHTSDLNLSTQNDLEPAAVTPVKLMKEKKVARLIRHYRKLEASNRLNSPNGERITAQLREFFQNSYGNTNIADGIAKFLELHPELQEKASIRRRS